MARANENPYWLLQAYKGRKVLQQTVCHTKGAARDLQTQSERGGEFWWADHRIKPVPRNELGAHLNVG